MHRYDYRGGNGKRYATAQSADSAFCSGDGEYFTVQQPYTSNYGWVSEDFRWKVINLDGTVAPVGGGSARSMQIHGGKTGLRLTADELCLSKTNQVYPQLLIQLRRAR